MAHELVLTSVPQGLKPADSGLCPVAADQSLPQSFIPILTRLSNYKHLDTNEPANRSNNPVVYSHVITADELHVLSRVADCGNDYRNKPNVLAHHVVVGSDEMNPEGPAWLLSLPAFHFTQWTSLPLRFPAGRLIPRLTAPQSLTRRQQIAREHRWCDPQKMLFSQHIYSTSYAQTLHERQFQHTNNEQIALAGPPNSPCPCWLEATGDAGWGGVLADTLTTAQQVAIIFSPGQNLLPLFVEAQSLLPPAVLWRGTFTTYYTGFPAHTICQWYGCVAGSSAAKKFAKDSAVLTLDLTKKLGTAMPGNYVEFARRGIDYLLPEKETTDTFFQSFIDNETKGYGADEAPILAPKIEIRPVDEPHQKNERLNRLLSEHWQFYVLYVLLGIMLLFLLLLVLNVNGYLEIKKDTDRGMLNHTGGVGILVPDDVPEPAVPVLSAVVPKQFIQKMMSVLFPDTQSSLSDRPLVFTDERVLTELFEEPIKLPCYWAKYYALQTKKPKFILAISGDNIEWDADSKIITFLSDTMYKKIDLTNTDTEQSQPIKLLRIAVEVNETEIIFKDLYETCRADLRKEQDTRKKEQSELNQSLDKLKTRAMQGDSTVQQEQNETEEKTKYSASKIAELNDLLENNKFEKAHKNFLDAKPKIDIRLTTE